MSEFTPGPWFAAPALRGGGWHVSVSADEYDPIDLWSGANARLIAAAPELLKACETALANLAPLYSSEHLVIRRLRTAIAKATGEVPS